MPLVLICKYMCTVSLVWDVCLLESLHGCFYLCFGPQWTPSITQPGRKPVKLILPPGVHEL